MLESSQTKKLKKNSLPSSSTVRRNPAVLAAHSRLLKLYRMSKESLIHNDLHLGNLLVGITETPKGQQTGAARPTGSLSLIDYEFATVRYLRP